MAKSDITGKRKLLARNVSHSNIKTKRWQHINVQSRRLWVAELGRFIRLDITTRDLRTIDKIGLLAYAKQHGVELLEPVTPANKARATRRVNKGGHAPAGSPFLRAKIYGPGGHGGGRGGGLKGPGKRGSGQPAG
jgi:large subunit ribosomal protein L28